MSELTMRVFNQRLLKLYYAKEYTQALEQVEHEKQNFPENAWEITYWLLCLQALLGHQAEALRIFQEALARGLWFSPDRLARDPDLVSLRSLPEFQRMIEVCQQRFEAIRSTVQPELLVQQPTKQSATLPLLIALHGDGENAGETIGYWSGITRQSWLLAVPQSSQLYDPNTFVWHDRERGISKIRAHLTSLSHDYALDPERVVLGGFSAGGGQAIWMALNQSVKACGFVVLAPYLTPAELEALPALLASHRPPNLCGSIRVGNEDITSLEVSRKVVEIMHAYQLPCTLEIHPGLDHDYPADFEEFLSQGLARANPSSSNVL